MGTFCLEMRLAVVALLVVGCLAAPPPARDCLFRRVETKTGEDCVSRQFCKPVAKEECYEFPRVECSNSGCKTVTETKCEQVFDQTCLFVHYCPDCTEYPSSSSSSEDPYGPPSEDAYGPPY